MNDERLHVVETNRSGQAIFLFMLDGKQFARVRHRRFRNGLFFVRSCPTLEIDPPPAGQFWMLPLREIMVAIADVRKRLPLRNKEGRTQYIVGDPQLVDRRVVLTIRLGDDLDAVIHKRGYRKQQVRFPLQKQGAKHCMVPLHDAASALCDALRKFVLRGAQDGGRRGTGGLQNSSRQRESGRARNGRELDRGNTARKIRLVDEGV